MHADLIAALKAGWPIVHLVTVTLPDRTVRWMLERGFGKWAGNTYRSRDPVYGVLRGISEITDGIDDDASPVQLEIVPPSLSSLTTLASADAQGGWVTIHLACLHPLTGLVVAPYQLHLGELDQPRLRPGKARILEYDVITGEARGLQPNEEQRQTDAFRQYIWPGELGDQYATEGTKRVYWREDEPRSAIGILTGRGRKDLEDKAIQFTYEPNAPLAFPIGRCGFGGDIRYRVGYGPTNRYQTIFATAGASGPVKGLISASFDDEVTSFDGNNRSINGSHQSVMWFKFLPGAQPSPALTSPTGPGAHGSQAPGWTSAHNLSGRPCFAWTGHENSKKSEYQGGIPKPVLTLEGLFGHDPRAPGSLLGTPTTWPWMQEGCIAALNWCFGRWEGSDGGSPAKYGVPYTTVPVGGIAAPLATIDVAAFTAAADIADNNGWTMAGVAYSDQDKVDVLEDMLRASGAVRSRRCGMISCVSFGAPTASILTATQADTAAAPVISLAPSRLDRKNTGIASFLSETNRWEMTPIAPVTNPAWVTEDGGRQTVGFDYRYVPAADQAAQLIYLEMANDREPVSGSGKFKPWMLQLEPGKAFDWDEPEYLLVGLKVRVRKRTWDPSSCTVGLEFRQETDAKYTDAFVQTGSAPPPPLPTTPPPRYGSARLPVRRTTWDDSAAVLYPTSGADTTISILQHKAWFDGAPPEEFSAVTLTGLAMSTTYGVFGRNGNDYEVEATPALTHMASDVWVFIGWQSTSDAGGSYPPPDSPPPGWGGDLPGEGDAPVAGLPSSLVAGPDNQSNLSTSGSTWVSWGAVTFTNMPSGGKVRFNLTTNPLAMTLANPGVFTGNWRVCQGSTDLATGSFVASDSPSLDIEVPPTPVTPAATGSTSISFQVQRASGSNEITGGVDASFWVDWTASA